MDTNISKLLLGTYTLQGKKMISNTSDITLVIRERKQETTKPKFFLFQIATETNSQAHYISSLYNTTKSSTTFEYKGINYKLSAVSPTQAEITQLSS